MNKDGQAKIAELTAESSNPFAGAPVISCYTWEDAVNDGTFVEVTGLAKSWGFSLPVALTRSVFTLCESDTKQVSDNHITLLLVALHTEIKRLKESNEDDSDMLFFKHEFEKGKSIDVWASIEGRKPENPEPVMTILLPSDR